MIQNKAQLRDHVPASASFNEVFSCALWLAFLQELVSRVIPFLAGEPCRPCSQELTGRHGPSWLKTLQCQNPSFSQLLRSPDLYCCIRSDSQMVFWELDSFPLNHSGSSTVTNVGSSCKAHFYCPSKKCYQWGKSMGKAEKSKPTQPGANNLFVELCFCWGTMNSVAFSPRKAEMGTFHHPGASPGCVCMGRKG